jgi:hypothetical protein
MSDEEFHVHGAHDHEVEHRIDHDGGDSFAGRLAMATALLATVGAMFSYMAGATQADASLLKNDAAIRKTEANDRWNYYQAKSSKQNIAELGAVLANGERADKFKDDAERYAREKAGIQKEAEALEKSSGELDEESSHEMHIHHRWALATTLIQVSIAMSAIALLTRKNWLQWLVFAFAGGGLIAGGIAMLT